MGLVRNTTATRLVGEYRPPARHAAEAAGPCTIDGCTGQLEVRHERQYGKVYTVCAECERRVGLVDRLRTQITALREQIASLQKPSPAQERAAAFKTRDDEIVRRYYAYERLADIATALGTTLSAVSGVLVRRAVPRRVTQKKERPAPKTNRTYAPKICARPNCGVTFAPTGPRSIYCSSHGVAS